jgi:hypothetical protein
MSNDRIDLYIFLPIPKINFLLLKILVLNMFLFATKLSNVVFSSDKKSHMFFNHYKICTHVVLVPTIF